MNFRLLIVVCSLVHILAYSPVTSFPHITQVDNMCHSTCGTCSQVNSRLASSCLTCSSNLLGSHYNLSSGFSYGYYNGSYNGSVSYCFDQKNNSYSRSSSLFMIIDNNTTIGNGKISLIKLYKDNVQNQTRQYETFGFWGIYNESNILSFYALGINQITFVLQSIPLSPPSQSSIHGIIFRFYAKSSCPLNATASTYSPLSDENFNTVRYYSLTKGQYNLIEAIYPIDFYNGTVEFSVKFNDNGCQQIINEISQISEVSVYLLKCDSDCLRECKSDRKQCLMCDLDEFLFGTFCVKQTTCHSNCRTCSYPASALFCTSCYQTATETLLFGQCLKKTDSNIQLWTTLDKSIRSIPYKSIRLQSTIGTNGYLYKNQYGQTKNDTMKIHINSLPPHIRIYIRTKILSNCQPNSVKITLRDSSENMIKSYQSDLASYENDIYAEFTSSQLDLIIEISFTTNSNLCFLAFNHLSIYYATCQDYCGSNQCPNKPYYKHPSENKCVAVCPNASTQIENFCVPIGLCHSTCGSCTIKNDAEQCSSCSSNFSSLLYDTLTPPGACSLIVNKHFEFLMTVSKDTILVLGGSPLRNITYNSETYSTPGISLSALPSLFFFNVIDFSTLASNAVTFNFQFLMTYRKLIVRARFLTECSAADSQNTSVQMTLFGTPNKFVDTSLATNIETLVEAEVTHSISTFFVKVQFGTQGQRCRKFLQDFSIFYQKCELYCQSNDCPSTEKYFKHPSENKCVAVCPNGSIESENLCVPIGLCHSTCGSCTIKNDAEQCSSCSSNLSSLLYDTLTPPGACSLIVNKHFEFLMTVSKDTILVLGGAPLRNITYNSETYSARSFSLSTVPSLFSFNVIDFSTLTSNSVTFNFQFLMTYRKLIVRARFLTECSAADSQNTSVQMTLFGTPNKFVDTSLATNIETLVEAEVTHSISTFFVKVQFGTQGQRCRKFLQDFSIFYQKCELYCQSNDCPSTEKYFKHPSENKCVAVCPNGSIESENLCVPIGLCHSTCGSCTIKNDAEQCSSCSSNLSSLLYDTLTPPGACSLIVNKHFEFLMTVSKDTILVLGGSPLRNITYNSETYSTPGISLSALPSLFFFNVIDFSTLASNAVTFNFAWNKTYSRLIVRARFYTECIVYYGGSDSVQMILSGTPNTSKQIYLKSNVETMAEAEANQSTAEFSLMIKFRQQGTTCRRILQDFSIFYDKCDYDDQFQYQNVCIKKRTCHSTCSSCYNLSNKQSCASCRNIQYAFGKQEYSSTDLQLNKTCIFTSNSNVDILMSIDATTRRGKGYLKNFSFLHTYRATDLIGQDGFIYKSQSLQIKKQKIQFQLDSLPKYVAIIIALAIQSNCGYQPFWIGYTISSKQIRKVTKIIYSNRSDNFIQDQLVTTESSINITVEFNLTKDDCFLGLQDITIYYKKYQGSYTYANQSYNSSNPSNNGSYIYGNQSYNSSNPSNNGSYTYASQSYNSSNPSNNGSYIYGNQSYNSSNPSNNGSYIYGNQSYNSSNPSNNGSYTYASQSYNSSNPSNNGSYIYGNQSYNSSNPSNNGSYIYGNQSYNSSNPSNNGSYTYANQSYNSSNSSQNQSTTQSDRSLAQCLQSLSKCTTNHSLYFVIVLDFVYEEFSSSIYDSFLDQILVLVAFPSEWSRQLKLKYLKIHNLMKGSVYINGTFYYLNQSGLNTAKTRFKALSQNALSLGGFRVQSMGFVQQSPGTNELFFGNNTLIVPEPINAENCNDSENPSSCTEQSSSSSMIIIIAASAGGGVLIVVVAVVIYCCWKRKKTLKETDEKENDESKSDSTQQIEKNDGLRSAQNLKSHREQKVQNVGRQLRFD